MKRGFTTKEAARYTAQSVAYLKLARSNCARGKATTAPKHTRIGTRKVIYLLEDLDAWLDDQK